MLWWAILADSLVLTIAVRRYIKPVTTLTVLAILAVLLKVNIEMYRQGAMQDIGHATSQSEAYTCDVADSR